MIRSYKCKNTKALSKGNYVKQFEKIAKIARRKLRQLEIAGRLDDLRVPRPAIILNRLKAIVLISTASA